MCKTVKKAVVLGLLAVGAVYVCKNTRVGREAWSYVSTCWNRNTPAMGKLVSRDFEIDRVENEIKRLEGDKRSLLSPVAEKQAIVNRLQREVGAAKQMLTDRRAGLQALTTQVEAGNEAVTFNGQELSLPEARVRLSRDFSLVKRLDAQLKTKQKLLNAQQQVVDLAKKQLDRLADQIDELQLRLTQVRAAEQQIQLEQAATPQGADENQISEIRAALDRIQQGQEEETIRLNLEREYNARGAGRSGTVPAADLNEIKAFLGGRSAPSKVAAGN